MWWFRDSLPIRWRHAPSRSLFHLRFVWRFVFLVVSARLSSRHAISKLDDSPQHQNISCNAKQFNVQPERLMFCKDVCTLYHSTLRRPISRNATLFACTLHHSTLRWAISRNATPFVCTLYHSTLRWAISHNATLFICTLYHSTLRWAIWRNATPFVRTLCYSTLPWAIWRNAISFVYRISNECLAIRNWASPFHNFMFQLDKDNWTVYHLARLFMFRVFCFMKEN